MTDQITDADMARIKEAAGKATPGEWEHGHKGFGSPYYVYSDDKTGSAIAACQHDYVFRSHDEMVSNAEFIALARNHMTALIARVEAAEAKLAKARDALKPFAEKAAAYKNSPDHHEGKCGIGQLRTAARVYKETGNE